jgi:hypothetical protein
MAAMLAESMTDVLMLRVKKKEYRLELGCNVVKGNAYFVSLYTIVVITEQYNVTVNSEKLICTPEDLTL